MTTPRRQDFVSTDAAQAMLLKYQDGQRKWMDDYIVAPMNLLSRDMKLMQHDFSRFTEESLADRKGLHEAVESVCNALTGEVGDNKEYRTGLFSQVDSIQKFVDNIYKFFWIVLGAFVVELIAFLFIIIKGWSLGI